MEDTINRSEPVCIDARRVYDSCSDKDCLRDLTVYFSAQGQQTIDDAINVRLRDAEVLNVMLDIEPVPFHRGFYSIDMTYFFMITLDVFNSPYAAPDQVQGLCISDKKVILYGSEGNVKVFSSDMTADDDDIQNMPVRNLPLANCQVAQPIALAAKLKNQSCCCAVPCKVPESIATRIGGTPVAQGEKSVEVTLGVFSIVQLLRNVQMLIPSYDFCVPDKSCSGASDSPCEVFSRIEFPTDEFFPPNIVEGGSDGGCCCQD